MVEFAYRETEVAIYEGDVEKYDPREEFSKTFENQFFISLIFDIKDKRKHLRYLIKKFARTFGKINRRKRKLLLRKLRLEMRETISLAKDVNFLLSY